MTAILVILAPGTLFLLAWCVIGLRTSSPAQPAQDQGEGEGEGLERAERGFHFGSVIK